MENKFFLRRIQEENGSVTAGVEVHDTLDAAVLSYWGRVKTAYNDPQHPNMTYVSCKIKNAAGATVAPYDMAWPKDPKSPNKFYLYHVKQEGDTISKGLDVCADFDAAKRAFAACMEYGYNNSKFPNVTYVSCEITDRSGTVMAPFNETWNPTEEPEPAE